MKGKLDTVKTGLDKPAHGARKGRPTAAAGRVDAYHHGALREALVAAAEAVIAERGVDGFSLREAARRAGVSPAAPQHHFGDARGLLTAVAVAGFQGLAAALEAADLAGPATGRMRRQGVAYVRFALREPARFDVMWRKARIDGADPAYVAAANRAYALLKAAVSAENAGATEADAVAAWSLVHGFARLALDGVFGMSPDAAADAMLDAVLDRLT